MSVHSNSNSHLLRRDNMFENYTLIETKEGNMHQRTLSVQNPMARSMKAPISNLNKSFPMKNKSDI